MPNLRTTGHHHKDIIRKEHSHLSGKYLKKAPWEPVEFLPVASTKFTILVNFSPKLLLPKRDDIQ
jgi:hypothetical protein